jgi:hypothetical protein
LATLIVVVGTVADARRLFGWIYWAARHGDTKSFRSNRPRLVIVGIYAHSSRLRCIGDVGDDRRSNPSAICAMELGRDETTFPWKHRSGTPLLPDSK